MPFSLLAESVPAPNPQIKGLLNLNQALPGMETLLKEGRPLGIVYLDIAKYGQLEGNYGQETFDEIVAITADVLTSFSGTLFRREDRLLICEELGDVFIIVFSATRSEANITLDVMQRISHSIQENLNEEIKARVSGLIQQKIGYYAGYSILYPDSRVNSQRQIFRSIKDASQMSLGRESDEFERKMGALRDVIHANQLTSYFQPIVGFEPYGIVGHELLTRGPGGSRLVDSEMMFQVAQRGGLALELERAGRNKAIETLAGKEFPGKIFLNNSPRVILSPHFADLLIYERLGWDPSRIVIEITEGEAIVNLKEIRSRLEIFRREGCKIAVDDMGKGNSGLYLLTELQPDYAKIDMTLVRGIDRDELKQRLLKKLIEFAENSGTEFVAEGIETADEFATLKDLGIKIGQGFYLGLPKPFPLNRIEPVMVKG